MVRRRRRSSSSSSSSSSFRFTTLLHLIAVFAALTSQCSYSKTDSLLPSQPLRDGETLVSASGTFALGFFSLGSSTNRYVGIWFDSIPEQTVVWVGNRNSPLVDTSGYLVINYGDLIIMDGKGSSTPLAFGAEMRDAKATILDSGNFVLSESGNSSNILWQSFDDPTDTWLPGMKIGLFGQQNRLLTSWTSFNDPSPGDFSFGVDPSSGEQLSIWWNDKVYWTSGKHIGGPSFTISSVSFEFVRLNKIERYFTYTFDVEDVPSRLVIDSAGIQWLIWRKDDEGWLLSWSLPRSFCDVYNACGSFGVCDSLVSPVCSCLTGFIPESLTDLNNQGFTGCTRTASLQCGSGGEIDKFAEMSNMVFPLNPQVLYVGRAEECESACLNDCTCTAYAMPAKCNLWHGELMNLQILYPGDYNDSNVANRTIYIRLAASELESTGDKRKKRKILIVGITTTLSFVVFCSLFCLMWNRKRRNRGRKELYGQQSVITFSTTEAIKLWETEERGSQFSMFDFSRIATATNNFSAENKLGEGGFGPVYKGLLPEGRDIAVKRLAAHSGQGLVEFKNEILLIAKLQHRNLVRLLGCCIQGEEKILVYEYMPNKSLDFFLFDKTARTLLDWRKRFNIIDGIAQGLLYLHKHSRLRIIHRDLKASNILLDEEMNPKISDFGMARIFGSNETQANTNRVVGTYGYMSPEYAMEGLFSVKSDVFSFGVLLLEIVSGLRNAGFHRKGNSLSLLGHAWELWKEGRWIELVDESLGEGCPEEVLRCIHVALMCVQEIAVDRPTMSEVVAMLSSENASLPDPKQPAFITISIAAGTSTDWACSPNVVTVSVPEGR